MYAILTKVVDPKYPVRPLAGSRIEPLTDKDPPEYWKAIDPLTGESSIHHENDVMVLGDWESESDFKLGDNNTTWAQYAAHQLGQVLRQNELAARLRAIGVDREDEPYILTEESPVYKYRFQFTFDELDLLLRAAER